MKGLLTLFLLLGAQTVYCDDLSKKRVPLRIEPRYASDTPGYLLLVFGEEASTPVWVATDREYVYIDRNSNGDLSEKGERVEAVKIQKIENPNSLFRELRTYDLGEIAPSTRHSNYTKLRLQQFRNPTEKFVPATPDEQAQIELLKKVPHLGGNVSVDVGSFRQNSGPGFATTVDSAPVVHFDGPLSLSVDEHSAEQPIEIDPSSQRFPFQFRLGTQGLGIGSFAYTEAPFEPTMRAVFGHQHDSANLGTVELRYCGANYCTTVKLPPMEDSQTVTLHISVRPVSGRNIEPLQLDVKLKHQ
jgi:hypothetical protein